MISSVLAAVRSRLEAAWDDHPIHWPNEAFAPPEDSPWVALEVMPNGASSTAHNSAGKRAAQDDGLIWVHVYVPTGTGEETARGIAEAIGAVFRGAVFSGTGCRIACGAPTHGGAGDGDDEGLWHYCAMSVPFSAFYTA
jgi:hypothetical protein